MAIDVTLADMRKRIVDEIQRPDLQPQITNAIYEACNFYRRDTFFRQDKTAAITLQVGQSYYAVPAGCNEIRAVFVVNAGQKYPLNPRDWEYIDTVDSNVTSPITGAPTDWARFLGDVNSAPDTTGATGEQQVGGDQIRLFPRPDQPYPLEFDFVYVIPAPVADGDQNFWTTDARTMIRCMAKYYLKMTVIKGAQGAELDKTLADDEFRRLKQETGMKKFTGRIKSYW